MPQSKMLRRKIQNLDQKLLHKWKLPSSAHGDKNDRGAVLIIGGAPELPGAVILAATCALRAGAGKLQVATDKSTALAVATLLPEALVTTLARKNILDLAENANGILVGPGLAPGAQSLKLVRAFEHEFKNKNVVFDAEALKSFRTKMNWMKDSKGEFAVTPHHGEMAAMMGVSKAEVEKDPAFMALEFAKRSGAITVLKSSVTYIATPTGELYRNTRGNAGLGTSGSGDCLAGTIAGLAARGTPLLHAAAWGVYLHAMAGEALAKKIGPLGYLAREIPIEIPRIMANVSR